jgi:hypothetical protein
MQKLVYFIQIFIFHRLLLTGPTRAAGPQRTLGDAWTGIFQ